MNKDKIGICVIGAGRAGLIHARSIARHVSQARLVALVDTQRETVETSCRELEVTRYYLDYRQALEDENIDAVAVVTPTVWHKEIAVASAKAGKHVFVEKPMAMNAAECDEMIGAAAENRVKLQVGFMRRFDESFMAAKEQVDLGIIGRVVLVKSLTRGPSIPQQWQYDISASNGTLAEVNSHDIDTLRWLTASEFQELHAIAGNYRCPDAREDYPDFYDNVSLLARFDNNCQGIIDGAVSVGYGYDARVEILGTKGVIFVGRTYQHSTVTCSSDSGLVRPFVKSWSSLFLDAYRAEEQDFVLSILEDREPRVTGLDGKRAVEVVIAGNLSIKERRPVLLRSSGRS